MIVYFGIAVLWLLGAAQASALFLDVRERVNKWDFSHYYLSALVLREGGNPYITDLAKKGAQLGMQVDEINRASYPPAFLLCFEPMTLMRPVAAYWVWFALNLFLLATAYVVLLRVENHFSLPAAVSMIALSMLYLPLWHHFNFAQCQILVLTIMLVMMRALRRGDDVTAGLSLALASLLRVFPIVMAGYLIARHRFRALKWMCIGLAAGSLVTVAFVGPSVAFGFLTQLGFLTGKRWYENSGNVSIAAVISRVWWAMFGSDLTGPSNSIRPLAIILADVAVFAATLRATNAAYDSPDQDWRAFSLWIVAIVMLSPTAWPHYLVLFFIPFAQIASGRAQKRTVWMAAASFILMDVIGLKLIGAPPGASSLIGTLFTAVGCFIPVAAMYLAAYWFASEEPRTSTYSAHDELHQIA
jgi:hypothetical protein